MARMGALLLSGLLLWAGGCAGSDQIPGQSVTQQNEEEGPPRPPGQDTCHFALNRACNAARPDFSCFGHPVGHDGWIQEHVQNLDCPDGVPNAPCGGDPAQPFVISVVRLCREGGAGQIAPCPGSAPTGAAGCSVCTVTAITCQ